VLIGSRLGSYDVLAKLGEGGMGEVYRARDTKLGREVALKILPEAFASDPDRLMRFEREARTLASLNHPHIAQVYGVEDSGTTRALVMELVAGEDLSARIARGPIPLDEALPIARQIAEALEAAHEAGIIHRDLKPANIKVRDDGTVKVLDFGLAKALDSTPDALGAGATITSPALTVRGVILGTAAYMAPEQAKGKPVDRRADIWAFGCVLYEMLTGTRAFKGDDITDTLTAVLRDEPDWGALPADTPAHLRGLLRRCLVKDPKQRLRDIGDARLTLQEPADPTVGASPTAPRATRARTAAWLVGALALAAFSFAAARLTTPPGPPPAEVRFEVSTPSAHENWFAISPDGRRLAFVTEGRLAIRDMEAIESRVLPGTGGATNPTWSPSGRSIAYTENFNRLVRVAADGTARETIADQATGRPAWLSEDEIVFTHADNGQLHRVSVSGGAARPLFAADAGSDRQTWPAVLPGTDRVIYLSRPPGDARQKELRIGGAGTGTSQSIVRSDSMGVFAGPNTLLFIRNNDLFAQPFDADRLATVGDPVRVSAGVSFNTQNGRGGFDASANGLIVLRPGSSDSAAWTLRQLSRDGQLVKHFADAGQPLGPALSPDGTRVAFHRMEADGGGDVWMLDLADAVQRRFTFERSQENASPVWSPDGRRLVYRVRREAKWALVEKPANGAGGETTLAEFPHVVSPMSWSPDGTHLLFMVVDPTTSWDIWQYAFADRTATPLLNGPRAEGFPQFSPDGRWFAYNAATATPTQQVFIESFPRGRGKWQIPSDSGQYPRWSANGRQLYFLRPVPDARSEVGGLLRTGSDHWAAMAVDVRSAGEGLALGPPRRLFETHGVFGGVAGYSGNYNAWAVSGDGQQFFLQQPMEAERPAGLAPLVVIMNHPALRPPTR
jgi:Tol biopolymer transport system component